MKKFVIVLATLIFLSLLTNFLIKEKERYDYIEKSINNIVKEKESPTFSQLYNILNIAENSLIDIDASAKKIAEHKSKKERGYVLKGGIIVTCLDNWMFDIEKRVAKAEEVKGMYIGYLKTASSGFYSSSLIFYLLHLLKFGFVSLLPLLLSILTPIIPAVTVKYATVMGAVCLFAIIRPVKSQDGKAKETTIFETDFFLNGKGSHYEFLMINLTEKMTHVFYVPPENAIAATGPNMKLGGGSLSLLGGVCIGNKEEKLVAKDLTFWYIYFGSFFNGYLEYTTFGLYDQPISKDPWWIWFKHQINVPITEKLGVGLREDTNINPEGLGITYGPAIKLKFNSLSLYAHYRIGNQTPTLLIRAEIPIN